MAGTRHTHTLRKKVHKLLKKPSTIENALKTLIALATNDAESLGIKEVPASTMRLCAKDLLEMGIDVEKQIQEWLLAEDPLAGLQDTSEEDDDDEDDYPNVIVESTAAH